MRSVAALLAAVCFSLAAPAFADQYSITVANFNMPAPSPIGSAVKCRAYLGTTAVGGDRACGTAAALTFTVPAEGSYALTYVTLNSANVESLAKSPGQAFTVNAPTSPVPPTPTTKPSGTFSCSDMTQPTFACNFTVIP